MKKVSKRQMVTWYVTEDGMTFSREGDAIYHEAQAFQFRVRSELVSMELQIPFLHSVLDGTWFLIRNQDELRYFLSEFVNLKNYIYINDSPKAELHLGDWVAQLYRYDEYGDKESRGLITLEYAIQLFKEFIESAEKVTVEGKY